MAIPRALMTRLLTVLADEPAANLDTETGYRISTLMCETNDQEKTTLIFSMHFEHIIVHAGRMASLRNDRSPAPQDSAARLFHIVITIPHHHI